MMEASQEFSTRLRVDPEGDATRIVASSDTDPEGGARPGEQEPPALKALLADREAGRAKIGRYAVLRVLGRGGMGVVFSAYSGLESEALGIVAIFRGARGMFP